MPKSFQNRIPHYLLREQLSKLTYSSDLFPKDLISPVPYTSPVHNRGIIFDESLTFADHINYLSRTCHMHIRDIRRLPPILDYKTACTVISRFIMTKLTKKVT